MPASVFSTENIIAGILTQSLSVILTFIQPPCTVRLYVHLVIPVNDQIPHIFSQDSDID